MPPFCDLSGQQFGYLRVIARAPDREGKKPRTQWTCECTCGTITIVRPDALLKGSTRSCGCQTLALRIPKLTKHGHAPESGQSPEYSRWSSMAQRCTNPNHPAYKDYGGRGIKLYEEWHHNFPAYLAYMQANLGPRPSPQHSLDRIDNNGNYEPGNLRWATRVEQIHNRRYGPGRKKGAKDNGRRSVRSRV